MANQHPQLQALKALKASSDKRDYRNKHRMARMLIRQFPDEFYIDSEEPGITGITHSPTNFRFHLPVEVVPPDMHRKPLEVQFDKDAAYTVVPLQLLDTFPSMELLKKAVENEAPVPAGVLPVLARTLSNAQKPFGGPNPLLTTLAMGGIGGLGAYGAARVAEAVLPEPYKPKRRLARLAGLAGAGLAAAPALALYAAPAVHQSGISGLWTGNMEKPAGDYESWTDAIPVRWPVPEWLKSAVAGSPAGNWAPTVAVDVFNDIVVGDQYTPRNVRAATVGVTEATSRLHRGSRFVSPADIATTMVNMGTGAATGWLVGKTLGTLAGLEAPTQQRLQQAGVWGGTLSAVMNQAFGR